MHGNWHMHYESQRIESLLPLSDIPNFCWIAGLDKVWEVKPLVNGKEIMNVLQLKAGGPLVREWVRHLL